MNKFKNHIYTWLQDYTNKQGGVDACRHGGCFELVEAFLEEHPDAEKWETLEIYPHFENQNLSLQLTNKQIKKLIGDEYLDSLGSVGGHAVCYWKGYFFDAAGIASLQEITDYFHTLKNVKWVKTI